MRRIEKLLIISFCFLCLESKCQELYSLPFDICDNRILIRFSILGSPVDMCFDTGANYNFLHITKAAKNNSINCSDKIEFVNFGIQDLRIQRITNYRDSIFGNNWAVLISEQLSNIGCDIDGIVSGQNMLECSVVEVNFLRKQILGFSSITDILNSYHSNIKKYNINKPSVGYETPASAFTGDFASLQGTILFNDSTEVNTQFLIDTGSKFELALVVTDSLLIRKYSNGKEQYKNELFGIDETVDFTYVSYGIENEQQSDLVKSLMFYSESNDFSIFGSRKIGVLLGVPFFIRNKSIIIDNFNKKLYLVK